MDNVYETTGITDEVRSCLDQRYLFYYLTFKTPTKQFPSELFEEDVWGTAVKAVFSQNPPYGGRGYYFFLNREGTDILTLEKRLRQQEGKICMDLKIQLLHPKDIPDVVILNLLLNGTASYQHNTTGYLYRVIRKKQKNIECPALNIRFGQTEKGIILLFPRVQTFIRQKAVQGKPIPEFAYTWNPMTNAMIKVSSSFHGEFYYIMGKKKSGSTKQGIPFLNLGGRTFEESKIFTIFRYVKRVFESMYPFLPFPMQFQKPFVHFKNSLATKTEKELYKDWKNRLDSFIRSRPFSLVDDAEDPEAYSEFLLTSCGLGASIVEGKREGLSIQLVPPKPEDGGRDPYDSSYTQHVIAPQFLKAGSNKENVCRAIFRELMVKEDLKNRHISIAAPLGKQIRMGMWFLARDFSLEQFPDTRMAHAAVITVGTDGHILSIQDDACNLLSGKRLSPFEEMLNQYEPKQYKNTKDRFETSDFEMLISIDGRMAVLEKTPYFLLPDHVEKVLNRLSPEESYETELLEEPLQAEETIPAHVSLLRKNISLWKKSNGYPRKIPRKNLLSLLPKKIDGQSGQKLKKEVNVRLQAHGYVGIIPALRNEEARKLYFDDMVDIRWGDADGKTYYTVGPRGVGAKETVFERAVWMHSAAGTLPFEKIVPLFLFNFYGTNRYTYTPYLKKYLWEFMRMKYGSLIHTKPK